MMDGLYKALQSCCILIIVKDLDNKPYRKQKSRA